jgi:dephospho-CoA kinase
MIVGFKGKAGAGKDTACDLMQQISGSNFSRYALASPIKVIINEIFGWDERHSDGIFKEEECYTEVIVGGVVENVFNQHLSHEVTPEELGEMLELFQKHFIEYVNYANDQCIQIKMSPRRAYQLLGTEVCRTVRDTIWLDLAPVKHVFITDIRFENEAEWLRKNKGLLIEIQRDTVKEIESHVSELGADSIVADVIINNNKGFDELKTECVRISETYDF